MENLTYGELMEIYELNGIKEDIEALNLANSTLEEITELLEELLIAKLGLEVIVSTKIECNKNLILEKRAEAERKAKKKARKERKKRDKLIVDDPILGEQEIYFGEQVSDTDLVEAFEALKIEEDSVGFDFIMGQLDDEQERAKKQEEEEVSRRFWEYLRNAKG